MAREQRLICASAKLADSGTAVRFEADYFGQPAAAFAVRCQGRAYAYLNRCGHLPMELDWREGDFFDSEGRDLICSTHGATYSASRGECLGGSCGGTPLVRLLVEERDGQLFYLGPDDD